MPCRKISDFISGVLFVVLGAFVYVQGSAMPAAKRGLGPGGYPKFIAVGLMVLGLAIAVQYFFKPKAGEERTADRQSTSRLKVRRALFFAALCFVYSQAIYPLGFILSSMLFLIAAIYFFGYRKPVPAIMVSILLPILSYLVFRYAFLVLIPTGTIFR